MAASKNSPISLGVHPFARATMGDGKPGSVHPWLHPVFYLDIGVPNRTETLIEQYRVPGHTTYLRRFTRGVVLYARPTLLLRPARRGQHAGSVAVEREALDLQEAAVGRRDVAVSAARAATCMGEQ